MSYTPKAIIVAVILMLSFTKYACAATLRVLSGERSGLHSSINGRSLVLEIQVQSAIGVVVQLHPTAEVKSIEPVRNLEAIGVVESDRPEGICGRRAAGLIEMERVPVCSTIYGDAVVTTNRTADATNRCKLH